MQAKTTMIFYTAPVKTRLNYKDIVCPPGERDALAKQFTILTRSQQFILHIKLGLTKVLNCLGQLFQTKGGTSCLILSILDDTTC